MKIVQILIKSTTCIYSEVLVHLKNIESPDYSFGIFKLFLASTKGMYRHGICFRLSYVFVSSILF